ncbi:MAG TPA: 50S ribosomal protein L40e [archaeon]|nr:50S ribosomal protein L40e [archaeon]
MARFKEADARLFANMWICMKCNAPHRARPGTKPGKCRKCGGKSFRTKNRAKKSAGK